MSGLKRLLKFLGYGFVGWIADFVLMNRILLGSALGFVWHLGHHPDLRAILAYPITDERGRQHEVALIQGSQGRR